MMPTRGPAFESFIVVAARAKLSWKLSGIMILVDSPADVRDAAKLGTKTSNCPAFQMAAS